MPYNYIERHDIVQNGFKQQLSDLFQVKAVGNLNSTQFIDICSCEVGLNKHREHIIKHKAYMIIFRKRCKIRDIWLLITEDYQ